MHISKFKSVNGVPDEDQVQAWVESYFQNTSMVLNSFFVHVSAAEAVDRMAQVPFAKLIAEELEDESETVIKMAVELINELAAIELECMRAYL